MSVRGDIHQFVEELLIRIGDNGPLRDDESLLVSGRLQSVDAIEIVMFLEQQFGIDFAEIGFDQEQLDSVDAMCALVEKTKANPA